MLTMQSKQTHVIRERETIGAMILGNVLSGKFEFKRGNTLAMFAEAMTKAVDLTLKNTTIIQIPEDIMMGTQQLHKQHPLRGNQISGVDNFYAQLVQSCDKLVPFYKYYFQYYKANKRLVVLDLLSTIQVYDSALFQVFVR